MFRLIRLQFALMPFLWSLFTEGASDDPAPTDPQKSDPIAFTPEQQAHLNTLLATERRAAEAKAKADIEAAQARAKAEAEAAALAEQGKHKELAEQRAQELERLKTEREQDQTRWRERVIRSEIRIAASQANFIDPDDAYRLLDHTTLAFNDEGEITNATEQINLLAERKPHLVQQATTPRGTGPTPPPSNYQPTRDDIKNKYLKQAGVAL